MPSPLRSVSVRTDVTRVLVVTAHPDDVDFGAAGTVATWTAAGIEVAYCICTSGDAGGFDDTPRHEMAPLREAEQRAAAKEVGVSDVRFLGYPDGRLTPSLELRRDISREIRRVRPHRVLTRVAGDLVAPPRRLAPGPPRRRRGRPRRRLPRRAQPVRPSGAARRGRAWKRGPCASSG